MSRFTPYFTEKADILRIPAGTNENARVTVIDSLPCSEAFPLDGIERERAGMATIATAMRVYADVPFPYEEIKTDYRLLLGEVDYRIHNVLKWPVTNPEYLEIFLEAE